ncbi:hypothetical protein [Streptomyces inhibens]|uniref:hypothetical protein n=1 Tax=Streptomyces inhibens TaxID=2293571 RepID=UPI000FFBE574|nr:hypothetical protein [Streptomyces inhibens]
MSLPGATEQRLAVEAELCERGRPLADSPTAAAALVVVGVPGDDDAEWLGELCGGVPEPKGYVAVPAIGETGSALTP